MHASIHQSINPFLQPRIEANNPQLYIQTPQHHIHRISRLIIIPPRLIRPLACAFFSGVNLVLDITSPVIISSLTTLILFTISRKALRPILPLQLLSISIIPTKPHSAPTPLPLPLPHRPNPTHPVDLVPRALENLFGRCSAGALPFLDQDGEIGVAGGGFDFEGLGGGFEGGAGGGEVVEEAGVVFLEGEVCLGGG